MSRHDATHGTVQGDSEYRHLQRSRHYRRFVSNMIQDKLSSLAKAVDVLQGFYSLKSAPELCVTLYGEQIATSGTHERRITVLPYFACTRIQQTFDLLLNQDSFPEINSEIVRGYLEWMKATTKFFTSINHENTPRSVGGELQNNVAPLIDDVGDYRGLMRQPYWLRRGYVVELYALAIRG